MKKYLFALLVLTAPFASKAQIADFSDFFNRTDLFLSECVSFGRIDYKNINKAELDTLIYFIGETSIENEDLNTKKAFLINAYNLIVIHQVVENYPVTSPMSVQGFFEVNSFEVAGEKITLNHLENNLMRAKYPDPRYHFVLVCGAIDCPPIDSKAYKPDSLESHLEERTKSALNNEGFVFESEGTVFLSQIFEWYAEDFGKNSKEVLGYINNYRTNPFTSSKVEYYDYDWMLNATEIELKEEAIANAEVPADEFNIQTFTAGSLLRKGQMDYTIFNTIYTETRGNWAGNDFSGSRQTLMTSLWQFTIGVDKRSRINVGLDLNFRANATSRDSTVSSLTAPFAFSNTDSTRFGLTSVGLRAKVAPFESVKDLSIQTTVFIPLARDGEGIGNLYWADWDRITMWNQLFYTKTWNKFQLFTEIDALIRFKYRADQVTHVDIPMTVIGSYFPTPKWTLYGLAQHTPRITYDLHQTNTDWVLPANWTSLGAGVKFQPKSNFTIELLYTNFLRGVNTGLGSTFNLGFKYITK